MSDKPAEQFHAGEVGIGRKACDLRLQALQIAFGEVEAWTCRMLANNGPEGFDAYAAWLFAAKQQTRDFYAPMGNSSIRLAGLEIELMERLKRVNDREGLTR